MHWLTSIALISGVSALPSIRSNYAVKESHPVPRAWTNHGRPDGLHVVNLQIGLKQADELAVDRHMLKSSDPDHAMFRQHLSAEELADMIRPSDKTLELVNEWLSVFDIHNLDYSPAKDWIYIRLPLEQAEELLQTTYSKFKHATTGEELVRTSEWSLPRHLHDHIDVIQPTTSFFRARPMGVHPLASDRSWSVEEAQAMASPKVHSNFAAASSDDSYPPLSSVCNATFVTPDCIRTLYRTRNYEPKAADRNVVALTNYLNETNYRRDIYIFLDGWRNQTVAQSAYTFRRIIVANGSDDQGPYTAAQIAAGTNIEGNLDAEQVLSVSWPTKLWAYNIGGSPPFIPDISTPTDSNEPYLDFINYVQARKEIPYVVTSSYGDSEQTVPPSYARAVCRGFKNMGARGITVLVSSGDSGVGSNGTCFSNTEPNKRQFIPEFPTSCEWVTSVGATFSFAPEVAVKRFASGGGFSNYFPRPAWQNDTVNKYIASLGGAYAGLYNQGGRAYPDVAAQGNADVTVWNSRVITVGGTSASSPTFAGVLALVNDGLIAAGKPVLGFINPWIYKVGYTALNDIVNGSSFGCETKGFPAQQGWDAVTGFGTPDFPKLLDLAMQGGY